MNEINIRLHFHDACFLPTAVVRRAFLPGHTETIAKKKKKKKKKKKTNPIFTVCRVRLSVRQIGKKSLGFVVFVTMCLVRSTADKSRLQKAHTMETEHRSYSLSEMFLLLAYLLPTAVVRTENWTHGNDKAVFPWYIIFCRRLLSVVCFSCAIKKKSDRIGSDHTIFYFYCFHVSCFPWGKLTVRTKAVKILITFVSCNRFHVSGFPHGN